MTDEKTEALQGVLDRMTSYQDGAEPGTVRTELVAALDEVGIDLDDSQVDRAVEAIEGSDGTVDAAGILGS